MANVYHKNLTGTDLHTVKPHAGSHFIGGNDLIDIGSLSGQLAHGSLLDVGASTHAQLDAHAAEGSVHFSMAEINHGSIADIGTNTHTVIDSHISEGSVHFGMTDINHGSLISSGAYTHDQLDAHINSGSHGADRYLIVPFISTTVTLTNMPVAITEHPAVQYRHKIDLANFTSYRATMRIATIGAANAKTYFQYSNDDTTFAGLDTNSTTMGMSPVGQKDTGWLPMSAGARINDCYLRMMGYSGDGALDPVARQIALAFKG